MLGLLNSKSCMEQVHPYGTIVTTSGLNNSSIYILLSVSGGGYF